MTTPLRTFSHLQGNMQPSHPVVLTTQQQQQRIMLQTHLARVLTREEKEILKQLGQRAKELPQLPQHKEAYVQYLNSLLRIYPITRPTGQVTQNAAVQQLLEQYKASNNDQKRELLRNNPHLVALLKQLRERARQNEEQQLPVARATHANSTPLRPANVNTAKRPRECTAAEPPRKRFQLKKNVTLRLKSGTATIQQAITYILSHCELEELYLDYDINDSDRAALVNAIAKNSENLQVLHCPSKLFTLEELRKYCFPSVTNWFGVLDVSDGEVLQAFRPCFPNLKTIRVMGAQEDYFNFFTTLNYPELESCSFE
jgi:hypothetical protein